MLSAIWTSVNQEADFLLRIGHAISKSINTIISLIYFFNSFSTQKSTYNWKIKKCFENRCFFL